MPNGLDKNIVKSRGNMPDDTLVRTQNTCTSQDFKNANLWPDFCIKRILPEGYEIYRPENPDKKFTLVKMLKTIGLQKVN